ncbi:DUF1658 domain-containing protein [Coxiella burnetii]|nr:DUF1658 domain-containing protein [Coxiella burnetii]NP_820158.2 hypothetical protein CBU_1161 [Coxiella burnetii RSA 493]AZV76042.1 DUF1658 domain-containing protein [Coxiella burnetii]OYK80028.1 DUF1658 domain-containing protein [Coxiella burnetii]OYK82109.1 DUF1658 domain-containing protein [Coxiella burnetii]OYK84264.1 DUF1658 domain-containing protein [Coxiella burnetii]OYK86377.1 DUF1658 domain-containing protein [Coxiella burnetii]
MQRIPTITHPWKREKLKTRRPSARPSTVILKNTKPSRPSRGDPD